jgi:hypothetical protein
MQQEEYDLEIRRMSDDTLTCFDLIGCLWIVLYRCTAPGWGGTTEWAS